MARTLADSFSTIGSGVGFPPLAFFTIGIFAPIFSRTFGWPFASIMGGLLVTAAVILLGGPMVGYVIDRHGPRKVAAVSSAALGLSYISLAFSNGSLALYYASWTLMAVTGLGATVMSFTHAINSAFVVRRGLALGITLAGSGVFALLVKPFAYWAIDFCGWRASLVFIGLLPLLIGAPLVLWGFPRHRARAMTLAAQPQKNGLTLRAAFRTRAFWLIAAAFLPISFANGAPMPNMENILRTARLGPAEVVQLTSLIGVAIVVGRLTGGWLVDRIWAPLVGAGLLVCAALGCFILSQGQVGFYPACAAVLLLSLSAGVEFDLLSYLIARYVGVRSYGTVFSVLFGIFAIGGGGGPPLLGHAFDASGSYSGGLRVCAVSLLIAGGVLLALGRYPDFAATEEATASAAGDER